MIGLDELIDGTAVNVPVQVQQQFKLVQEALALEEALEDMPEGDERADRLWVKACARSRRRLDALDAALQAHNDAEVLIVCGS